MAFIGVRVAHGAISCGADLAELFQLGVEVGLRLGNALLAGAVVCGAMEGCSKEDTQGYTCQRASKVPTGSQAGRCLRRGRGASRHLGAYR